MLTKINKLIIHIIDHPTTQRLKPYLMVVIIASIFVYTMMSLQLKGLNRQQKEIVQEPPSVTIPLREYQKLKDEKRR